VAVLVLGYSVKTVDYATKWRTRETLYRYLYDLHPQSPQIAVLLADELRTQGRRVEAEAIIRDAAARMPDCWNLWQELGVLVAEQGREAEAQPYLQRSFELNVGQLFEPARKHHYPSFPNE
jgi:predicted Zn-dependent protease